MEGEHDEPLRRSMARYRETLALGSLASPDEIRARRPMGRIVVASAVVTLAVVSSIVAVGVMVGPDPRTERSQLARENMSESAQVESAASSPTTAPAPLTGSELKELLLRPRDVSGVMDQEWKTFAEEAGTWSFAHVFDTCDRGASAIGKPLGAVSRLLVPDRGTLSEGDGEGAAAGVAVAQYSTSDEVLNQLREIGATLKECDRTELSRYESTREDSRITIVISDASGPSAGSASNLYRLVARNDLLIAVYFGTAHGAEVDSKIADQLERLQLNLIEDSYP